MSIQLIEGRFNPNDALDLIAQMVHIKIKYHESKIINNDNEDDIKSREAKIKRLQKELFEFGNQLKNKVDGVKINALIQIEQ
jgi:hypothetical protein